MRYLTSDEQKEWRKEYQQKEDEVQKNIAVYLSALVIVTGWVFSPQAKPVVQTVIGNDGLNVVGILLLLGVNAIFTCFLIYKSIQIHEITQFVAVFSPTDTVSQYWERWRRSEHSLSRKAAVRGIYMAAIGSIPFWISMVALVGTWNLVHQNRQTLASELLRLQNPSITNSATQTGQVIAGLAGLPSGPPQDLVQRIDINLRWAYLMWWGVAVVHVVPFLFLIVSWLVAKHKWDEIHPVIALPEFGDLRELRTSIAAGDASGSAASPVEPERLVVISDNANDITVVTALPRKSKQGPETSQ